MSSGRLEGEYIIYVMGIPNVAVNLGVLILLQCFPSFLNLLLDFPWSFRLRQLCLMSCSIDFRRDIQFQK